MAEAFVLDSYAVLALLWGEPGGDQVSLLLRQADTGAAFVSMSWVNVGEVLYIIERRWGQSRLHLTLAFLQSAPLEIVDVGQELALQAAHIKARYSLSYADAYTAALAASRSATVVTGDPEFRALEGFLSIQWLPREN